MKNHSKNFIGGWETSCLVLNLCIYRSCTHIPGLFTKDCGTAAPLAALVSGLVAVGVISLLFLLYKKCGCHSIIDTAEKYLGRLGKALVSAVLVLYLLISSAFALREFSLLAAHIAFPSTPLWFIAAFLAVAALFAAFRGSEAVLRTHTVVVPFTVLMTLVVLLSALGYGKSDNLFPILGNGVKPILSQSLQGTLLYSDIILLFLLNPFCDKETTPSLKPLFLAATGGIALTILLVLTFTATTAYPESLSVRFPIYQLLKTVWYGRFFQRIDAVYMLAAILSGMLYLSVALWLTARTAKLLFCPKTVNEKLYISLSTAVVFVGALSYEIFSDVRLKQCLDVVAAVAVAVTIVFFAAGAVLKLFRRGMEK